MWPFSPIAMEAWSSRLPSTCVVCGSALAGTYCVNDWGDEWCSSHRSPPSCTWCGRMTDLRLDLGRYRCAECRRDGVDGPKEVAALCPPVLAFIRTEIGPHALDRVPVVAAGGTLTSRGSRRIGRTHTTYESGEMSARISLSTGMPKVLAGSVLAHEYGHVVLAADPLTLVHRGEPRLDPPTEEGFCELLAWEWLMADGGPDAHFHRRRMETSPDPVYGDGLRAALQRRNELGSVRALLDDLRPTLRSVATPPVSRVRRRTFP